MGKTKYIDADKLKRHYAWWDDESKKIFDEIIDLQPDADVIEVVRCGECKYQDKGENDCEAWNLCGYRPWLHIPTEDDAFCSKGERKDG